MPIPTFTINAAAVGAANADEAAAVTLTVTHDSGWSGTISGTRYLSRLLSITANLKSTSALAAGTEYSVATVTPPTGCSIAVAGGSVEAGNKGTFTLNTGGTMKFRPCVAIAANTNIYLRHLAVVSYA